MKKITCKNCGGVFSEELDKCPYCSTMNKKGAYSKFRGKISNIIDQLLGLGDEAERSVSMIIFLSILRALVICAMVIGLAFVIALFRNVNYYNDKSYDERLLRNINWENENIATLNEAYANNDLETIDKLYDENSEVVYRWQHFPAYYLKSVYQYLTEDEYFDEYSLADNLYFIYFPDYYTSTVNVMSEEEIQEYENLKKDIIDRLVQKGYTEKELKDIYDSNKDQYGYLTASDLEKYVKGGSNG